MHHIASLIRSSLGEAGPGVQSVPRARTATLRGMAAVSPEPKACLLSLALYQDAVQARRIAAHAARIAARCPGDENAALRARGSARRALQAAEAYEGFWQVGA